MEREVGCLTLGVIPVCKEWIQRCQYYSKESIEPTLDEPVSGRQGCSLVGTDGVQVVGSTCQAGRDMLDDAVCDERFCYVLYDGKVEKVS